MADSVTELLKRKIAALESAYAQQSRALDDLTRQFERIARNGLTGLQAQSGFFEFGAGTDRLDTTGLQFKTGTTYTPGIFWLPDFSTEPTTVTAYAAIRAYVTPGTIAALQLLAQGSSSSATLSLAGSASADSASVILGPVIGFAAVTSNPAASLAGSIFYRSDENSPYTIDNSGQIRNLHSLDMNSVGITHTDSPYTVGQKVGGLRCDATSGAITVNLPDIGAGQPTGRTVVIWKSDASANAITITPNGADRIEGAATYSLSARYKYVILTDSGDDGAGVATWKNIGSN